MCAMPPDQRSWRELSFAQPPEPGLVSVIVPSYNRAHTLEVALRSALSQTYGNIEVIVVDDGSTDGTRSLVESLPSRVTYLYQENAGVSAARNRAMSAARGEYIAFLDSDDCWYPWKIEAQLAALRRCPGAGIVWTDMAAVDAGGHSVSRRYLRTMYGAYGRCDLDGMLAQIATLGAVADGVPGEWSGAPVRTGDLSEAILLGNLLHTSTVLFRREYLVRTGGFDCTYRHAGEDYEFYVRLTQVAPVVFVDAPTILYRVGAADQLTNPAMLLEVASNNLRTLRRWSERVRDCRTIPPKVMRKRIADSFAWVGYAELDVGHNVAAASALVRSITTDPRLDERTALLLACGLPAVARHGLMAMRRWLRRARLARLHGLAADADAS